MKHLLRRLLHPYFHFWRLAYDSGANTYRQCDFCGKRDAYSNGGGYQPFDTRWLNGGERPPELAGEKVPEKMKEMRGCQGYNVPKGDYYPTKPAPSKAPPKNGLQPMPMRVGSAKSRQEWRDKERLILLESRVKKLEQSQGK
jgi:hypothetical protein